MWLLKKFNILFWLKFFRLLRNSDKIVGKVFCIIGNYFVENHGWIAIITGAHLVEINYQVLNLIIKPSNYDFLQTNQKSNCNKLFLETYIYFWNVKYWIKLKQIELTTGLWLWDLCHSSECPLHSPDPESWII